MGYQSLEDIFAAFNELRVMIIGDVMIDEYIWGSVDRISPEAPVPVVRTSKRDYRLGGAANVALNIQSLGATPVLCSIIGNDGDGTKFIKRLKSRKITSEGVIKGNKRKTPIKTRILSGSQHLLRVDSESDNPLNKEEEEILIRHILKLMDDCHVIIFQDYDKGTISPALIRETVKNAGKKGIPTVVDPKRRNFLEYRNTTLFKPNLKELKTGLNIEFDSSELKQIKKALHRLKMELSTQNALVTLSERGVLIDSEKGVFHIPAHVRSVSDVSGAGDTVVSIAALCIALDLSPKFTASLANLGGGLVCEFPGVAPVDKERLLKEAINEQLELD